MRKVSKKKPEISTEDKITILKGKKQIRNILEHNFRVAKKWIKETRTFEYIPPLIPELENDAQKRGVKHYIIATKKGEEELKLIKSYIKRGVNVRWNSKDH